MTLAEVGRVYRESGALVDPHTATATFAANQLGGARPDVPVVTLATAHPAKFPDAVARATGIRPALPPHLADLFDRPERTQTLPNDLATVQKFVRSASNLP
jgi:threonine synthase